MILQFLLISYLLFFFSGNSFQTGSQETSVSGSQASETGNYENDSMRGVQPIVHSVSTMSFAEAQRLISLFFALCTKVCLFCNTIENFKSYCEVASVLLFSDKTDEAFLLFQKPTLLQLVFDIYGRAPKTVKQVSICLLH